MTTDGQKSNGRRNDFQLLAGFSIDFPSGNLTGSVGNDNHMTVADCNIAEMVTILPGFNPRV